MSKKVSLYSSLVLYLELNTIWTERFDVGIVKEWYAVEVDDPQVGRGLFQGLDVDHLVDLPLLLLAALISPWGNQGENKSINYH